MRPSLALLLILLCLLAAPGCKSVNQMLHPPGKQSESALDDFVYAMRWQQYREASMFMKPEFRKDFLKQFKELKDLTITDVRLMDTVLSEEGKKAEVLIEIEYYLLPSVTLKTFELEQTWTYVEGENLAPGHFQIITPFPPFP